MLKGKLDKYFSKHSFIPYRPYIGVREYSWCRKLPPKIVVIVSPTIEACIGVLGIQDSRHFTSRDIGYYPFYFQGYGILGSIF